MTLEEFQVLAAKAQRGEITEQELQLIFMDVLLMVQSAKADMPKLMTQAANISESLDNTFPKLLARAEKAELHAKCMYAMLKEYMDESELGTELARRVAEASLRCDA